MDGVHEGAVTGAGAFVADAGAAEAGDADGVGAFGGFATDDVALAPVSSRSLAE